MSDEESMFDTIPSQVRGRQQRTAPQDIVDQDTVDALSTVIGNHWPTICGGVGIIYTVFQALVSTVTTPCLSTYDYGPATRDTGIVFVSMYALSAVAYTLLACWVHALLLHEQQYLRGIYACAATVNAVAGCATGLFLWRPQEVCVDGLGVITPNPQWAEWLVLSPLLGFMAIAVEEKADTWTWRDTLKIANFGTCIFFGFLMNMTTSAPTAWGLFTASCVFMSVHVVFRYRSDTRLSWVLLTLFPLFPVIYLLTYAHVMNADQLVIGNMIAGGLTKFVFIGLISTEVSVIQLQTERRQRLHQEKNFEYIYKDILVPVHLLKMNMGLLDQQPDKYCTPPHIYDSLASSIQQLHASLHTMMKMRHMVAKEMLLDIRRLFMVSMVEEVVERVQHINDPRCKFVFMRSMMRFTACKPRDVYGTILGDRCFLQHVMVYYLFRAVDLAMVGTDIVIDMKLRSVDDSVMTPMGFECESESPFLVTAGQLWTITEQETESSCDSTCLPIEVQYHFHAKTRAQKSVIENESTNVYHDKTNMVHHMKSGVQDLLAGKYGTLRGQRVMQEILRIHDGTVTNIIRPNGKGTITFCFRGGFADKTVSLTDPDA